MLILVLAPQSGSLRGGNWVTACRIARHLRSLGHSVRVGSLYGGEHYDALVALHAEKSAPGIERFHRLQRGRALVVVLAGTDLYGRRALRRAARRSLALADRLVVLHPGAALDLPRPVRAKARVILQSAVAARTRPRKRRDVFEVAVVGHLRAVKDPFRAALAARRLPPASRLRVLHSGGEAEPGMAARAKAEMRRNPRYHWLGEQPHAEALRLIARSRMLVLTSRNEGGANVISEALVAGVPVISSAHRAAVSLLGKDYPGLFPVADTAALSSRLLRAEADRHFCARLARRCARIAGRLTPAREREVWRRVLAELGISGRPGRPKK